MGLFSWGRKPKKAAIPVAESPIVTVGKTVAVTAPTPQDAAVRIQARVRGKKERKRSTNPVVKFMTGAFDAVKDFGEGVFDSAKAFGVVLTYGKIERLSQAEVDAPTGTNRWFSVRDGWTALEKRLSGTDVSPVCMMPTAADVECFFPLEKDVIGELRVEVLECENLPNKDSLAGVSLGNKTDAYAVLVFEDFAARTSVVFDELNPQWGATHPSSFRAFAFPVQSPYSMLYVSIHDFDGTKKQAQRKEGESTAYTAKRLGLNSDDPIGRVAVQLGRLVSDTQYDCWFELGSETIEKPNGKLGSVRLRFSVTFKSERARMLGYLRPSRTPIIPLNSRACRRSALFAKRGVTAPETYDWDVLMAYVEEFKIIVRLAIIAVANAEDTLLWRRKNIPISVLLCLGFQLLISYPQLVPASSCIAALIFLHSTYDVRSEDDRLNARIHERTSFPALWAALLLNIRPKPLTVEPELPSDRRSGRSSSTSSASAIGTSSAPAPADPSATANSPSVEPHSEWGHFGPWTLTGAVEHISHDLKESAEQYWREQIFGDEDDADDQLFAEQAKIQEEVEEFIDAGDDSVEERIEKDHAKVVVRENGTIVGRMVNKLNPVALALGPVQRFLGTIVVPLRGVRYALYWQDRILTMWLYIALLGITIALALIPWAFVLYWGARLGGFALLGPHMHWVGRMVDRQRAITNKEILRYKQATKQGKKDILSEYKAQLMQKATEEVNRARLKEAGRSKRELEKLAFLEEHKYNMVNTNTPGNQRVKFVATADPSRSCARPMA